MANLLEGKVCLITGAASGIGEATVRRFAAEGAIVYAADIATASASDDGSVRSRHLDVTNEAEWADLVSGIVNAEDRLDVLVNNAGLVGSYADLAETDLATWNRIIDVNQTSVFLGMRSVIPVMRARSSGSIVNMSSLWGVVGAAGVAAYQASKGAVSLMSKNAAVSYAKDGIRVNSVHPGLIMTPMTRAQDPAVSQALIDDTPMGRAGEASEVASVIAFLASDESSYVTGLQLMVDGGFSTK